MISIFTIMNNPHSCWGLISCNRIDINTDIFIEVHPFFRTRKPNFSFSHLLSSSYITF